MFFILDTMSPDHRWRAFLASVSIMCTCGAVYLFSSYSAELAQRMKFSDTQLNNISTAGNVGLWLGALGGLCLDRYGVYYTLRGGSTMAFFGLLCIAASIDGTISKKNHWFIALANFVFCQGQGWAYLGGMKGTLKNFDNTERGQVIGTLVLFFALSAGILSQCYKALFQGRLPLEYFFYFMAVVIFTVQFLAAEYVRVPGHFRPLMNENEKKRLTWIQGFGGVLAVWILLMSIVHLEVSGKTLYVALWVVMVMLLVVFTQLVKAFTKALPLEVYTCNEDPKKDVIENPFGSGTETGVTEEVATIDDEMQATPRPKPVSLTNSLSKSPSVAPTAAMGTPSKHSGKASDPMSPIPIMNLPAPAEVDQDIRSYSWGSTLLTPEFLLLISLFALVLGYPITLLNNASQVIASLQDVHLGERWTKQSQMKGMQNSVGLVVAGFATFNAFGRILFGKLADRFEDHLPRPTWVIVASSVLLLSNIFLLVTMTLQGLYCAFAFCAVGMGGIFSLTPLTVVEVFGLEKYGRLWGVITAGPCVSTVVFSTLVAGHLADSRREVDYFYINGRRFCRGTACYRTTLIITALAGAASLVVGIILLKQLRKRQCHSA